MPDKNTAITAATEAARGAADATIGKTALGVTLTGGTAAMYGGYTLNEWAMILGAIAAVGGLLVQCVVQWHAWRLRVAKAKREQEWHDTRMAAIARNATTPETDHMGIFCDTRESLQ